MAGPLYCLISKDLCSSGKPAVCSGGRSLTYTQMTDAVYYRAQQLRATGILPGEHVGIIAPNCPEYVVFLLSLWSLRAVACPLNVRLPQDTIEGQLRQIHARHVLTPENTALNPDKPAGPVRTEGLCYHPDQPATIVFTSGSGAKPKAACHTIGNHIYSAQGSNEFIPVTSGNRWLLALPLYHVGGLGILFRVFLGGGAVVMPQGSETIAETVKRHDITHMSLVPAQLARLLANKSVHPKLKNMTAILVGGSPVPESLLQRSLDLKLPVYTTYGLTEMTSQVATGKYPMPARILKYRKIKIAGDGEILASGETLFQGYVHGKGLTLPLNNGRWFATGDLGRLSVDGGLVVTGRKDNMFISGGENIQPEEIERYLCQMASVEQAVVVPVPHKEFGHRPVAFLKTNRNAPLNTEELSGFLKTHLPKFKIPERFYPWPEESITETMKIDRRYLIQKAKQNYC